MFKIKKLNQINPYSKHNSSLNLDMFDVKTYDSILSSSNRLRGLDMKINHNDLMKRDVWASFYKSNAEANTRSPVELMMQQKVIEQLHKDAEFSKFKEMTKMDEFSSTVATLKIAPQVQKMVDVLKQNEELKKTMDKMKRQQNQIEKKSFKKEELERQLDKQTDNSKREELEKQIDKLETSVKNHAKRFTEQQNNFNQQAESAMAGTSLVDSNASLDLAKTKNDIQSMIPGSGRESEIGYKTQLKLFEMLEANTKLKKIVKLAGKLKETSVKTSKAKTRNVTTKKSIELGNDITRILPGELVHLMNPETETQTLRRYAEGELLQYAKTDKDPLAEGAVVYLKDISGSMKNSSVVDSYSRAEIATALTLATWQIASKKKRPFAIVEFNNGTNENFNPTVEEVLNVKATGGTSFYRALKSAFRFIENNKQFKKADIIITTDGADHIQDDDVRETERLKKKYNADITTFFVTSDGSNSLRSLSNHILEADEIFHLGIKL